MDIVNFGSLNLDYVYKVPRFVTPGETLSATEMCVYPGGKGLNQSVAMGRAGAVVYHAGCVGTNGGMLRQTLEDNRVRTDYLWECGKQQGHALIQVNRDGENCIVIYSGSNHCLTREGIDEVLGHFGEDTYVVLQNEINDVEYVVDSAYRRGMKLILNPSPIDEGILRVDYRKISWLLVNEIEAGAIGGNAPPEELPALLEERYPGIGIVLTLGKDGCICRQGGRTWKHAAYPVQVVDTTAAGDTFAGYFVAGLARGGKMEAVLDEASAAAALAVSREGASPSIPFREEVELSLRQVEPGKMVRH